jgi:glycerol-3-phosphate acyltransferase PlsY
MNLLAPAGLLLACYLIGSIPFSFLVVKAIRRTDIRHHGSGNVGATNVARTVGKLPGLVALLLDGAKGWGAIELARLIFHSAAWPLRAGGLMQSASFWIGAAAVAVVIGHMYPVWLRFHGGKGVATATGVFIAIDPAAIALGAILFFLTVGITRYISLGSVIAAVAVPIAMRFVTGETFWTLVFSVVVSMLVIFRHRSNIARLMRGEERRFPS